MPGQAFVRIVLVDSKLIWSTVVTLDGLPGPGDDVAEAGEPRTDRIGS